MLNASELEKIGLIAIVRSRGAVALPEIAGALSRGGIRAIELTLNTPGALAGIAELRESFHGRLHVGAGTILSPEDARAAIAAGAEFVVTPTVQVDTIAVCRDAGVPVAGGALTPTEALAVHRAGADFVKLFPADGLGPGYVRSLLGPLPFLKIIPTGGVRLDNLAAFAAAGCVGVALGGNLVSAEILERGDWARLEQVARDYAEGWAATHPSRRSGDPPSL